jgi:hypothetical protein
MPRAIENNEEMSVEEQKTIIPEVNAKNGIDEIEKSLDMLVKHVEVGCM